MANPKDQGAKVIDLVARIKKRSQSDRLSPDKDIVIRLALEILAVVRDETQEYPLHVLTALQVVNNTLAQKYLEHYGKEEFTKMVTSSSIASRMYEAHYTEDKNGG